LVYEIKGTDGDPNKINTLSTANGETYEVRLPDGSLVHLNAASSLTYSVSLMEKGKRVVVLMGEGYFEIAKDKKHPFIVKTAQQEVEVLGTHFNIMAYKDEPIIATTLVEGSVKVRAAGKEWVLKPDEQALNTGNQIKVGPADIEHITDWKNGDFNLNKVNLRVAMRKIARWYNVQVVYEEEVSEDILAGGWVSRSQKLSTILNSLEKSGLAKFQIKGNTVYVSQ
jgi:ferric-dicitrate binding protein FerR (iron transport regulator)